MCCVCMGAVRLWQNTFLSLFLSAEALGNSDRFSSQEWYGVVKLSWVQDYGGGGKHSI